MRVQVTPSLVISLLALVMATTGTAVAAKTAITGKDIKNGSITSADIAKGAIKSKHLAKKSVKGANIADGAVGSKQITPGYAANFVICRGGVIIPAGTPCPASFVMASGTDIALPYSVPIPGGGTCYGGPIVFEEPSTVGAGNHWLGGSDFKTIASNSPPVLTVNMTWGNTQDVTALGAQLMRVLPNNTVEPVPGVQLKIAPAEIGDTAASLVHTLVGESALSPDYTYNIEGYACTTGEAPALKSVSLTVLSGDY